ncbi:MAG: dihydrofolate reductase [Gammaproteobacteria bacterium]|nr:dihydrofolate reductase [Gammaproteobacteria bacterium]
MTQKPFFSIVVAMDRRGAIGNNGDLPWHQRTDLQRFRAITMGKPILMGRKTHDSIGRVLPGRHNIVLTRDCDYRPVTGCTLVHDLESALAVADSPELMIVGGADVFAMALPRSEKMYLTEIHAEVEANTFFPEFDRSAWKEISRDSYPADEQNDYPYSFVKLIRIN